MSARGTTKQRGYDGAHDRRRRHFQRRIDAGEVIRCRRGPACLQAEMLDDLSIVGGRILPGMEWDLGHDERDRSKPSFPEHRGCNRATMGKGGSRKRPQEPHPGLI